MNQYYFDKLIKTLELNDLDGILVVPSEELRFLFGFSPSLCERFQGMFVLKSGEYFYVCNELTKDEVNEYLDLSNIYAWHDNEGWLPQMEQVALKYDLMHKRIGVNSSARAFNILDLEQKLSIRFVNGREVLESIRLIKNNQEIELLKEAAKRTDHVMAQSIQWIKPGMTEGQIDEFIRKEFEKQKMTVDFAIVASGPNSALPHYSGKDRMIQNQDVVLIDIGGKYQGLSSDITRTIFVGKASEKQILAYQAVLEATLAGIEAAKKGVAAKNIDFAARERIENHGYGAYFTTRLGHGIGYSGHEGPYINGTNSLIIDNGMAFSIEPGIYIKGQFGIRIEDIVVVEEGQGVPINHITKDMIII